jgi:hypothetical protein
MRKVYKWNRKTQMMDLVYQEGYSNKSAFVRDDTILDGLESPLTGEKYYSMSQYRKHIAENGYEITGGDHFTGRGLMDYKHVPDVEEIRRDAAEVIRRNEWGMQPVSEKDRARATEEQRIAESKGNHLNEYEKHQAEKFQREFEKKYG